MRPEGMPIGGEPLRQAHKINRLVDEGLVTTTEASEASRREIDQMVEKLFDKQFSQNFFRPWETREKSMGQKAEDLLIDLLNRFPWFHVRHASDREDQLRKMDMAVTVEGDDREIPVQLATFTDRDRLEEKRKKTPAEVLLVAVPMADIFIAYEQHDEQRLLSVLKEFARQLLEGLRNLPEYLPTFENLQAQLAEVRA